MSRYAIWRDAFGHYEIVLLDNTRGGAKAVVEALNRGMKVQVILDKGQRTARYSCADFLAQAAVPLQIDYKHAIALNRTMVIDGRTVITGSSNFTNNAEENNPDNVLYIRSKDLAETYAANWRAHADIPRSIRLANPGNAVPGPPCDGNILSLLRERITIMRIPLTADVGGHYIGNPGPKGANS